MEHEGIERADLPQSPGAAATRKWTSSPDIPREAMRQILEAKPGETFVLINSLPRTASKYVLGVLSAAYGAFHLPARALLPEEQVADFHVAHCHGLSLSRSVQIMAHKPETLERALVQRLKMLNQLNLQKKVGVTKKLICISIARDSNDRNISNFVIQKQSHLIGADDETIIEEYKRFKADNDRLEKRWWAENLEKYFNLPKKNPSSVENWHSIKEAKLLYIVINIKKLDLFFDKFLFSQRSRAKLSKRSVAMELVYGLDNRNTGSGRSSDGFDVRVKNLIATLD